MEGQNRGREDEERHVRNCPYQGGIGPYGYERPVRCHYPDRDCADCERAYFSPSLVG